MLNIIKPKRPVGPGWQQFEPPPQWVTMGYVGESWGHIETGLYVISAVEVAKDEGGVSKGPEYHLSMSQQSTREVRRCSSADALWVLAQFDLLDAEEDNHVPDGKVRNWWRPVADHLVGIECACKADEPAIREDKGDYVWRGVS